MRESDSFLYKRAPKNSALYVIQGIDLQKIDEGSNLLSRIGEATCRGRFSDERIVF